MPLLSAREVRRFWAEGFVWGAVLGAVGMWISCLGVALAVWWWV